MGEQVQTFWIDFLSKQLPVIVVLGFGIYWLCKYFIKVIESKDEIIKEKEEEIRELNQKLLELTTKCL